MSEHVPLAGAKWEVRVNGRRSLNGRRLGFSLTGDVAALGPDHTIYDVLGVLVERAEKECAEVEFPDSIRITLRTRTAAEFENGARKQKEGL